MKATMGICVLALAAAPLMASSAPREIAGGIAVCGGVGADERRAMENDMPDANLRLELFVAPGGEYVAGVDLKVQPLSGAATALSITTDGPICSLKLAPGRYRIEATLQGVTRSALATVPANTRSPARVAIAFPKIVGDQGHDVPSPEEKAQERTLP